MALQCKVQTAAVIHYYHISISIIYASSMKKYEKSEKKVNPGQVSNVKFLFNYRLYNHTNNQYLKAFFFF